MEPAEWAAIQATGSYPGSPLDVKDGFLHMSPASEVVGTAMKWYAPKPIVLLVIGTLVSRMVWCSLNLDAACRCRVGGLQVYSRHV